ncbi:MAG: acyl-CoA thioesterase [Thiotrichales bacterium]|nr:acyl-CoA thioesterase [Thiotrichales bacterium]
MHNAKHRLLLENGIDFASLARQGINLMVSKIEIEIEYLHSIKAHDRFYITVEVSALSKLRYQFLQHIFKAGSDTLLATAKTTVVTVDAMQKPLRHSPLAKLIA